MQLFDAYKCRSFYYIVAWQRSWYDLKKFEFFSRSFSKFEFLKIINTDFINAITL